VPADDAAASADVRHRTQVGIVGAGPAGLFLSHLLARAGIDSIVLEDRSRDYVESRIRAGVLEQGSVDLLNAAGLGARMGREGLAHAGIEIRVEGRGHRIDFLALTGKAITVYGQHEVVKDLIAARLAEGRPLHFEVSDVAVAGFDGDSPSIRYRENGVAHEIACDFIAGCDGFHGICRPSVPAGVLTLYERSYPFAWMGILAAAPPASKELIYAHHEHGFALLSMRSPTLSRLYVQCGPEDDVAAWPDERIWDELQRRAATSDGAFRVPQGVVLQKGVTPMRSFVAEPMQCGRLFLAGDAAHIVPPTGAKGMNLAMADVHYLTQALVAHYRSGSMDLLAGYSARCLRRVWKAQRFSWWMTTTLHRHPEDSPFDRRRQLAELDYLTGSEAAMRALAENYVGLPLE
jgi:p-hydroxybenzoate 3-monooxygenase